MKTKPAIHHAPHRVRFHTARKFLPLMVAAGLLIGMQVSARAQAWFSPSSFWNVNNDNATLNTDQSDANGTTGRIYQQWRYDIYGNDKSVTNPNWRSTFSLPAAIWTAGSGQSTINVGGAVSSYAWAKNVPFPSNWVYSNSNSDHHTVIWQPTSNTLWEYWNCIGTYPSVTAGWGGSIAGVTTSNGIIPAPYGARATGLPDVGGIITRSEAQQISLNPSSSGNLIPHVIAIGLPQTLNTFVAPADRCDAPHTTYTNSIAEGRLFRLPADVALPSSPPLLRAVVIAARDYGMVVVDSTGPGNMISIQGELNKPGDTDYWNGIITPKAGYNIFDSFPWASLQVLSLPGTVFASGIVNDDSSSITYSGPWTNDTSSPGSFNSDEHYTPNTGNYAQFSFTSTQIQWLALKDTNRGNAYVYIDGVYDSTVDLYASSAQYEQVCYSKTGLSNGTHTIEVMCSGTKDASSTGYYISVDAFVPNPVNDNNPAITYSGSWTDSTSSTGSWLNDEHYTHTTGDYVQYTFTSPNIQWVGLKASNRGNADVYLDGVYVTTVDAYASTNTYQQVLFSQTGLSAGTHTIKVVCKGTKDASSSGYYISADDFQY